MERILLELSKEQFQKEFARLKSMTRKMAEQVIKIGGNDSLCLRAVMYISKEMAKNHLKTEDLESATLISNTETGEDTIKIAWNKKGIDPIVNIPSDESKEKRMEDVLRRIAGWLFTLSGGLQQFAKEDADKAIQDLNHALYGDKKPPLEYQFITGAEANEQAAKVFWRVNESVMLKLLEAARFAKSLMENNPEGAKTHGKGCTVLGEAIQEVEKHFGLKRD
jgi:hypothetical protein